MTQAPKQAPYCIFKDDRVRRRTLGMCAAVTLTFAVVLLVSGEANAQSLQPLTSAEVAALPTAGGRIGVEIRAGQSFKTEAFSAEVVEVKEQSSFIDRLKPGDHILAVQSYSFGNMDDMISYINSLPPRSPVQLLVSGTQNEELRVVKGRVIGENELLTIHAGCDRNCQYERQLYNGFARVARQNMKPLDDLLATDTGPGSGLFGKLEPSEFVYLAQGYRQILSKFTATKVKSHDTRFASLYEPWETYLTESVKCADAWTHVRGRAREIYGWTAGAAFGGWAGIGSYVAWVSGGIKSSLATEACMHANTAKQKVLQLKAVDYP